MGIKEETPRCHQCGWIYDFDQLENPDLKDGENEMSINEYKNWYKEKIKDNPDYDYLTDNYKPAPHICPVCGKYEFEDQASFDICPFCGWEDDGLQNDEPDYAGGANTLSLNDYKKQYEKIISKNPNYKWCEED